MKPQKRLAQGAILAVGAVALYQWGVNDGRDGKSAGLVESANAASANEAMVASRTGTTPDRDVYYPGTEELAPDEMRVIACGTGMPMPRLKQAAACFLIELGNGE
jgi:ribonuclease Z